MNIEELLNKESITTAEKFELEQQLVSWLMKLHIKKVTTPCSDCLFYKESMCTKAKPAQKPPLTVLPTGCSEFLSGYDIPLEDI